MGGYLLRWFWQIRRRTHHGFSGPQPITWPDIDHWATRSGNAPESWEIRIIEILDDVFFSPVTPPEKAPEVAAAETKAGIRGAAKDRRVVKRQPKPKPSE